MTIYEELLQLVKDARMSTDTAEKLLPKVLESVENIVSFHWNESGVK